MTDITQLIHKITWSGSRTSVARKLVFQYVQDARDPNIPLHVIDNGETVYGYDEEGNEVFVGNVYDVEKDVKSSMVTITAFDHLIIMQKSRTTRKFVKMTPEDIATSLCKELGVIPGTFEKTGVPVSFIAARKTGYQIIMMAYTEAAKKLNKDKEEKDKVYFHPVMNGLKLDIIKKGTLIENYEANGLNNLLNSRYKESIEHLVDQVLITDEQGNQQSYFKDDDMIKKYSMFQDVYKSDPNKDTQTEAKDLIKKPERSAAIDCLGDYRIKAPYSIKVKELLLKPGQFWIKSDTHTFQNGVHMMKLELEFENVMNEEKISDNDRLDENGNKIEKKRQSKKG
ncbi:MAG: hypothetical protein SOZ01_09180 [Selenomonadaceae bacterium]|nr:hypothetical protein [Selenomonadaceae bacterium]